MKDDDAIDKERRSVPEPCGVALAGVRIEALPWGKMRGLGQNGGYIAAYDLETGDELWLLKVYEVHYDSDMEEDKQDLFIEDLDVTPEGQLRVTDEAGAFYLVDVPNRTVIGKA